MKTTNTIKSLNVSLEDLYKAENKQIEIHLSDKPYVFSVVLKSGFLEDKTDCKISSFGANLWMRTRNGMNQKKYKTLNGLQKAIVNEIKNKVDTNGEITFKLSNEVYSF